MRNPSSSSRAGSALRALLSVCAAAAMLLCVSGCATRAQVKQIVAETNLAGLELPNATGGGEAESWLVGSSRIDAFIEANPDLTTTASALRVRQAMLLLSHRQPELAKAAFDQADANQLRSARDKALKNLDDELIWWFTLDKSSAANEDESKAASAKFGVEIAELSDPADHPIRDYLAEMRGWIELHLARFAATRADRETYLRDAVDHFSVNLTQGDIDVINEVKGTSGEPMTVTTRRQLRGKRLIKAAGERYRAIISQNPDFSFSQPNSNKLITSLQRQ